MTDLKAAQGFHIAGTGIYVPRKKVLSTDIDARMGWEEGTCQARYGLASRHVAGEGETSSEMAAFAAKDALKAAGIAAEELDLILGACGVMEQAIPSTAVLVQNRLGLGRSGIPSYDVNATCLSFVQALDLAALKIAAGKARNVLIFSADIASVGLDWREPETASIFGDGAAAVVLRAGGHGILASNFATYGEGHEACVLPGGGTRITAAIDRDAAAEASYFHMDGQAAFRIAFRHLPRFIKGLAKESGIAFEDMDCLIPHQASGPALSHGFARLGLDPARVVQCFARYGNQIATSIPTALHTAITEGRLKRGEVALLIGTSAGISLGGAVVRY